MAAASYTIWIDDLPEESIEADSNAELDAKLTAHLRSDGLAHVGDDVHVTVCSPDGVTSTSTVASHRGRKASG